MSKKITPKVIFLNKYTKGKTKEEVYMNLQNIKFTHEFMERIHVILESEDSEEE